jgi:hypothetical protein
VASAGLSFLVSAPGAGRQTRPLAGAIVRYGDGRVFLLDPQRRRYDAIALKAAIDRLADARRVLGMAQPSERLPARPGTDPRGGQAPLDRPRPRYRRLRGVRKIAGLQARAHLLEQGGSRQRVWFAAALPGPPASVRALLRAAGGGRAGGLAALAGRVPLQIDVRTGGRWRTRVRTVGVRRRALGPRAFQPPRRWRERELLQAKPRRSLRAASVPSTPIRCGLAAALGACGPVSRHPDIWAFYWGKVFKSRPFFVGAMNQALEEMVGDEEFGPSARGFWEPLSQYGIRSGRFLGYDIVHEDPPDSVGTWNFLSVDSFVLTKRFGSDAPNYWWYAGGHDPIFAIFVSDDEVSQSWGGYHFFTPTEATLFVLAAYPAMPWFVVRVPHLDPGDNYNSDAFQSASIRAAHELVEAETDPYPFTSWADPLKQPIWEQGEIADICAMGDTSPWGELTRLWPGGAVFATYWSERDDACVPESRPSIDITAPSDGATIQWGHDVVMGAQATDPLNGPLHGSAIQWQEEQNGAVGSGDQLTLSGLSPGSHRITATATGCEKLPDDPVGTCRWRLAGTDTVTITVRAEPPAVTITNPLDGASVASDQTVSFRGSAQDPGQGALTGDALAWHIDYPPPDGTDFGHGVLTSYRIGVPGIHTVTLTATNGAGLTASDSITLNVGGPSGNPSVAITAPPDGSDFPDGDTMPITFRASAFDAAGNPLSGGTIQWTDDLDGSLGTGEQIAHTLTAGANTYRVHHVTATVTDSGGNTGSDTITVTSGTIP